MTVREEEDEAEFGRGCSGAKDFKPEAGADVVEGPAAGGGLTNEEVACAVGLEEGASGRAPSGVRGVRVSEGVEPRRFGAPGRGEDSAGGGWKWPPVEVKD